MGLWGREGSLFSPHPRRDGNNFQRCSACYFCLGEETDNEGKPLLRDCSCRGDSAGFAHLSCLTKYAEQKYKRAVDGDLDATGDGCNNCKQPFQNQLAIDLVSAFVSYAEAVYDAGNNKWDKLKVIEDYFMYW